MIDFRIQKEKILRDPCRRQRLRKVSTNVYTNVPSNVSTKVLTTVNRIISREYSKWGVQEEGVDQPEYSRPLSYANNIPRRTRTPSTPHANICGSALIRSCRLGIPKVGRAEKRCRPALVFLATSRHSLHEKVSTSPTRGKTIFCKRKRSDCSFFDSRTIVDKELDNVEPQYVYNFDQLAKWGLFKDRF